MYSTRILDDIASALIDLTGCLNSPRQDEVLLGEAGVALDRALFPLLVRLNAMGTTSVTELAGQVGRDPSTVSRQLARLESLGLVKRPTAKDDMRVREAAITKAGLAAVNAIAKARRKLLGQLVQGWTESELRLFPELLQRLADAMKEKQRTGNSDA